MKTIGIVLVVLGLLGLVFGGINYQESREVLQVGSMTVTATEHKSFPIPAAAGAIILVGGLALLVVGGRRSSRR